jgi:hypothetical protein
VNFNRNEPATKKAKTNNEQLSADLAKQDARQVAASKNRVDRPIVDSPNQQFTQDSATLEEKGIEPGTLDDKYEAIRAMYLREFGQNPAAPEGIPNNFNKMASGEWMPSPTRIWSTKSRLFAKAQPASGHIATLGSGQVSPEALAAAKAEANRMRREIATNSGTASAKAASKELLRLDGAIKAYEKQSGSPAPAPAGKNRMAELQEKVAAKDTPKPRPPKLGPDPHIAMSKVASKSKRTAKESAALQEYMATLVNGSDDPAMQRKLDDINEKLEASRGDKKTPAPKKGSEPREVGPAPADDTAGLESMSEKQEPAGQEPVDQVASQPEQEAAPADPADASPAPEAKAPVETASEFDDPMYGAPEDEPEDEVDAMYGAPENEVDDAVVRVDSKADVDPKPGEAEVPVEAEAASPDLNAESAPEGDTVASPDLDVTADADAATAVDQPKPEADAKPGKPARRLPWKAAAVVGATVGGGAIINALRQGISNTNVDPFFPAPGGKGGGDQDASEAGSMSPMAAREMQSRKPFHALTPEERIRFLRTRYNQATPSTLTRPY